MYDAFIGYNEYGEEVWVNYKWLYKGCINAENFYWMYSLLTAQNPDIRQMINQSHPYCKFNVNDHDKQFVLERV